ncbi:tRNA methyltransferase 10 A-like protein [Aphelenchoides avenae]|nr:tRNA methyltransferase 10 A-like protein [Aphelenchus avenae]
MPVPKLLQDITFEDDNHAPSSSTMTEKAGDAPVDEASNPDKPLSKKQQKKLAQMEKFLENRKERRKQEKERRKQKRAQMRENNIPIPEKKQCHRMVDSKCGIRVAVDMAYEEYMTESLIRNTISQLGYCYAANRRAENPLKYHIVSFDGETRRIFDAIPGLSKWDAYMMRETVSELWSKEEVVYLSSESDNVLTDLEPEKVYIIGGLIDHNHHKGLCHSIATEKGYAHARLPIDEFVNMKTRKVLTINHVFEILLRFTETHSWENAFFSVIPKRKGVDRRAASTDGSEPSGEKASNEAEEGEAPTGDAEAPNAAAT